MLKKGAIKRVLNKSSLVFFCLLFVMSDLVPLGRLRYRPLAGHWGPSKGQLTDWIPLDHPFLDPFLEWWTKPSNVLQGRPIQAPLPQLAIYTDASTSSWWAHCNNQSATGLWSATKTSRHINELELLAIQKAVLHFLPLIRGKVAMIHSDSSSAFAYLLNQGSTHSVPMFHLTWQILHECQQQGITLLVRHNPGRFNVLTNSLSRRNQIIVTEWSLHPSIVCQMFSIWYIPKLDLFTTRHNNKLLAFVSPVPDPRAVAVDALSIPLDRHWVYAYPPTALMQRVLHKLVHSDQCRMLLVAPFSTISLGFQCY